MAGSPWETTVGLLYPAEPKPRHVIERSLPWPEEIKVMFRCTKVLVILALCCWGTILYAAAEDAIPGRKTTIKLLTWNIQMLPAGLETFSDDLDKMQLTRLPWIIEFLSRSDYDMVCLQEVLDPTATDMLVTGLQKAFPHIVLPPRDPARLLSSGVLFAARVPIEQVDFACYPDCSGVDCLASKGVTIIRGTKDGVSFLAAGTHLQAGSQKIRDLQYVTMANTLARHREPGIPLFVMGDFNTGLGDAPFEHMVTLLRVRDFPVDDPKPYSVDAENSWKDPGQNPRLIDHILLDSAGTKTTITKQTIQRARREHEGKIVDLADHYGVVAEIMLSSKAEK